MPKEPVVEGGAAGGRGLQDFVQGLNHVIRYLTPTVIMQFMQFWQNGGGSRYLTTADQGTDTNMTRRLYYRVPTIAGIGSAAGAGTDRLQVRAWAAKLGATNGTLRVTTTSGNVDTTISNAAPWAEYSINVPYTTAAAFEDVQVLTQAGAAGDHIAVKSLTSWIEPGADPCPAGFDVEPWVADEGLCTYQHRIANDKLEDLCRGRVGVVCNYSDDYESLGRGDGAYTGTAGFPTSRFMEQLQVKGGPFTRLLRVHLNGYYVGGTPGTVIFTSEGSGSTLTLTLDTQANFNADPTATWKTGTLLVNATEQLEPFSDTIHIDIGAGAGILSVIASVAIWEEPS